MSDVDVAGTALAHLRAGGVSVVIDTAAGGLPAVVYWGADLGELTAPELDTLALVGRAPVGDSRIDVPNRISVLPTPAEGWVGTPGISGSRAGQDFSPLFSVREQQQTSPAGGVGLRCRAVDEVARLALTVEVELAASGLLRVAAELENTDPSIDFALDGLVVALPVPATAQELLDLTGRHARERVPQRAPFRVGTWRRESRKGKPGLDSSYLLAAGEPGFSFTAGLIWAVHVGWSGNQVAYAEHTYNGVSMLGGGELLLPGEIRLRPNQRYRTPWLYASFGRGLNEVAGRVHEHLRSRPMHPVSPRPVVINTWEAVYFDQDQDRLFALATAAAAVGCERFVLDDGWFRGRRDDTAGLGDWFVDERVWPDGLGPLIAEVHRLGMDFGLWVEPEMINLDSDLARAHPEWIFRAGGRPGIPTRNQYVLDLGQPGAYDFIAGRLNNLLDSYDIAYLKWDHNRMVVEAGHGLPATPGVHAQTEALYRLLDGLRAARPDLEIETCAGGGGRIDLGILQRTDRVWASDCNDALERQQIQRYTQLLVPPELLGAHVGPPRAHTTHRTHQVDFRAGTAFWGHLGIEWDLITASAAELAELRRWVDLHKQFRRLIHRGTVVVGDHPDPAIWVHGVVAKDRSEAIFGVVAMDRSVTWPPGRACLPGLDPDRSYRVRPLPPGDRYPGADQLPAWWDQDVRLSGLVLQEAGLQMPALFPESLHLVRAVADGEAPVR